MRFTLVIIIASFALTLPAQTLLQDSSEIASGLGEDLRQGRILYTHRKGQNGGDLILASPDKKRKTTKLVKLSGSFYGSGQLKQTVLDSAQIAPFKNHPQKGQVRQRFQNAVESGKPAKEAYPFEYQYQAHYLPGSNHLLFYRYDYSQTVLYANCLILDSALTVQRRFQLPIDDGFTNHGLFLGNRGEVYLIHTGAEDAVTVIQYQPESEESKLLEIGPSRSRRTRLVPFFGADDKMHLATVVENAAGELAGLMIATLTFSQPKVESVQFHPVSADLRQRLGKRASGGHYDILAFTVQPDGERSVTLEKHQIAANQYQYDPLDVNHPANWKPRKQQVQTGERITFRLDREGKVLSEEITENYKTYP